MVWILPRKRSSKSHSTMMSKYKDLEQSDYFRLQQRKSAPKKNKPGAWFRIATLGQYPFYEVAYGETEDGIRNNEWNYIKTVESDKRTELKNMTPLQRQDWIVHHFSTLVPGRGSQDVHDNESEAEGGESTKRERSFSGGPGVSSQPTMTPAKLPPHTGESTHYHLPAGVPTPLRASSGDGGGYPHHAVSHGENVQANNTANSNSYSSSRSNFNSGNVNSVNSVNYNNVNNYSGSNSVGGGSNVYNPVRSESSNSSGSSGSVHRKSNKYADVPRVPAKVKKDANHMVPVGVGVAGVVLNTFFLGDSWFLRLLLSLFALLFVMSCYFPWACNVLFKLNLNLHGICSMVLSQDKKFKRTVTIPEMRDDSVKVIGEKRLIFIRHGESEWNNVFNKGLKVLFPRLFRALLQEFLLLTTLDSVFYDSPLNKEGLVQANQLSAWLAKEKKPSTKAEVIEAINYLTNSAKEESIIVSSPLRRAVATTVVCLRRRLKEKGEKVKILSCLSEISKNVDTISLADEPGSLADMSSLAAYCAGQHPKFLVTNECFDSTENKGRKPILGSGQDRLSEFCSWIFKRKEAAVIVGGHSLYFRYFFRSFLPSQVAHPLKEAKIPNSGIVIFTLQKIRNKENQTLFRIDPSSIAEVYGFGHD